MAAQLKKNILSHVLYVALFFCQSLTANQKVLIEEQKSNGVKVIVDALGDIHLVLDDAPLVEGIDALAKASSVVIRYNGTPDRRLSIACDGKSVRIVLQCLLGLDADIIYYQGLTFKGVGNSITILSSSFTKDAIIKKNVLQHVSGQKKINESGREVLPNAGNALSLIQSSDPEERVSGLVIVGQDRSFDSGSRREIFKQALTDEDGEVRAAAVTGLAAILHGADIGLLVTAVNDPHASVRLAAIDAMALNGRTRPYLERALSDTDETVRELASLRLEKEH
jgi:hypothetical protein